MLILGKIPDLDQVYFYEARFHSPAQDAFLEHVREDLGKKGKDIEFHSKVVRGKRLWMQGEKERLLDDLEHSAFFQFRGGTIQDGAHGPGGAALFADHFS